MWYSRREFIYRVGTFFLMVGLGLVLLFIISEQSGSAKFNYFCWGTILLVAGFMFRAQYRKSFEPSNRFGFFKRLFSKKDKKK